MKRTLTICDHCGQEAEPPDCFSIGSQGAAEWPRVTLTVELCGACAAAFRDVVAPFLPEGTAI